MPSDNVQSGYWTPEQQALADELSNSGASNMKLTSEPSQTPPAKRKPNVYQRVIAGERRIRGGTTR